MKVSYCKLPLMYVLFFWLFSLSFWIIDAVFVSEIQRAIFEIFWSQDLIYKVRFLLFIFIDYLPASIMIFIVSLILLNKYSIHQITRKNSFQGGLIMFITTVFIKLISYIYFSNSMTPLPLLQSLSLLLSNAVIILVCIPLIFYLMVRFFNPDMTPIDTAIACQNSPKLHLVLFILMYNYYFIALCVYGYLHQYSLLLFLAILTICNVLGYLCLRGLFQKVNEKLQWLKVVTSSFLLFVLNGLLMFGLTVVTGFFVSKIFHLQQGSYQEVEFYDHHHNSLFTANLLILMLLSCVMVRVGVMLFFGRQKPQKQS